MATMALEARFCVVVLPTSMAGFTPENKEGQRQEWDHHYE